MNSPCSTKYSNSSQNQQHSTPGQSLSRNLNLLSVQYKSYSQAGKYRWLGNSYNSFLSHSFYNLLARSTYRNKYGSSESPNSDRKVSTWIRCNPSTLSTALLLCRLLSFQDINHKLWKTRSFRRRASSY